MQAAQFIRSQASRLWTLNLAEKGEVSLPQPPSRPPRAQRQLPPELLGDMSKDHEGIDQPTLFAHLMKLSQDEAAAAVAAPAQTVTKKEAPPRMLPGKASTPSDDLATFKRDSADVRRWMKHALEDLHIDTMVVASAAALASQYLRRRYRLRSTYRGSGIGGNGGGSGGGGGNSDRQRGTSQKSAVASLRASSAAPVAAGDLQRGRLWVRRRTSGGSDKGGVKTVLLSVTCIHLATKYHTGCDDAVTGFGASVKLHSVIKLGFDISLSMGTFLNASFRANPVALQGLFCNTADESAVVRACSEWFALCLVLLLHPSDDDNERPTAQRGQRTPSPATSIDTGSTSSCSTSPASSDLDAKGTTTSPRTPSCPNLDDSSVAEQRGSALSHRRFSRATSLALGALVLARRLARSEGPCLPLRVQALIRVDNDESLQLVAEGIDAARSAFETIVINASEGEDSEDGGAGAVSGGGRDILAGDIVFGRIIAGVPLHDRVVNPGGGPTGRVPAGAERRTLLEWVSACRGDTQAPRDTAIGAGRVCPGEALACDGALSCLDRAPTRDGDKAADGGYVGFVRGVPLSVEEAVGSAPPLSPGGAGSSGCPSPRSNNDIAVRARGCDDSADSLAYSESAKNSTDGNEQEEDEEGEEMRGDDDGEESETQSKRSMTSGSTFEEDVPSAKLPRKLAMSSDMDDHTDLSESPYPSPSSPMDVSRAQASNHGILWKLRTPADKVGSPYVSSGTDDAPDPVFLGDAMDVVGNVETSPPPRRPLPPTGSVPSAGSEAEVAAYLVKKVAATRRSSRKRSLSPEEVVVDDAGQREGQRPTKMYRTTRRRKASSQEDRLRLRSATSKQQEREARWGIMKDRVVAALEYRCGCSFCKLRDDGRSNTTSVGVVEEGDQERRQVRAKATP